MRTAITLARKHGSKKFELVSGPEVPIVKQQDEFKALHRSPTHDTFESVQLWTSDSLLRECELLSPDKKKKQDADEVARIAKENKIQADATAAAIAKKVK